MRTRGGEVAFVTAIILDSVIMGTKYVSYLIVFFLIVRSILIYVQPDARSFALYLLEAPTESRTYTYRIL